MSDSHELPRVAANDADPSTSPSREGRGDEEEELPIDPEIEALLDFEPVVRKVVRGNAWTAERQRTFVANLARFGSRSLAAAATGRDEAGARKLCRAEGGESFEAACDAALALFQRRLAERQDATGRRAIGPHPGPRAIEGGWEEEDDGEAARQHEEALDSIRNKLLRARRLFLQQISVSPGKRAAFEILTELPVDWDKAAALEPQPDEPYNRCNQQTPDMLLTAESGWSFGEIGYGPDRKAAARQAIDEYRAEQGLQPIDWDDPQPECRGHSGPDHPERSGGGE